MTPVRHPLYALGAGKSTIWIEFPHRANRSGQAIGVRAGKGRKAVPSQSTFEPLTHPQRKQADRIAYLLYRLGSPARTHTLAALQRGPATALLLRRLTSLSPAHQAQSLDAMWRDGIVDVLPGNVWALQPEVLEDLSAWFAAAAAAARRAGP